MKREVQIFFTALMFYTRIPIPKGIQFKKEYSKASVKYLPLIGLLVGGVSAVILILLLTILPVSIAVTVSFISSLLLTGAFHEDGLADTVDGFGGGWNKEKILLIMKDSTIGAYGAIALVMALLLKFQLLVALVDLPMAHGIPTYYFILFVSLAGHSISRVLAVSVMITHQYARINDGTSKLKSITPEGLKWTSPAFLLALTFALFPLFLFQTPYVFLLLFPIYLVRVLLVRFFNKWIGGYTGDCLGAIQQISEIIFYLSIFILWKYI
ncbi:adenosylcobinamide-GDP ribazoletransferase [Algibacter sp. L4_22]|uniref:adenosylcobinamide-GDP ribazoletransferase n=1 Tax=Algibacter sp. L4_22 TaxID=2942477 RepID=UPI00201B4E3D|nr:adenosylcobinamide-GDP ribazoletransferase [Algibacter sp. L4_22]MCL5129225.1 adenosylcobinamide-GDP ribazoletransferase [Algibacter sp. L4_22]